MTELYEEYMVAWKQMQQEKKALGKPTAETMSRVVDLENKINLTEHRQNMLK